MMTILPASALSWNLVHENGWWDQGKWELISFGVLILALQAWMMVECLILIPRVKGVLEDALPPLQKPVSEASASSGA
jgi:carbon starvation protein